MFTSDEDVLNATVAALEYFEAPKITASSSKSDNSSREIKFKLSERDTSTFSECTNKDSVNTNSSACQKSLPSNSENNNQFQAVEEALEVINLMYRFYNEQKSQKEPIEPAPKSYLDNHAHVTSPSSLNKELEKIKTVLDHLKTISNNGAKLKKVLRSNVLNEFWKVNLDYHKGVVRFFTLAQEITSDINNMISSIEKSKELNPNRSKDLHILETKLIAELHENLDILNKFRDFIHSSITGF